MSWTSLIPKQNTTSVSKSVSASSSSWQKLIPKQQVNKPTGEIVTKTLKTTGGTYKMEVGNPSANIETPRSTYGGYDVKSGYERADIMPVSLSGVNASPQNITYEKNLPEFDKADAKQKTGQVLTEKDKEALKYRTATDKYLMTDVLPKYKSGQLSLRNAQMLMTNYISNEQSGLDKQMNPYSLSSLWQGLKQGFSNPKESLKQALPSTTQALNDIKGTFKLPSLPKMQDIKDVATGKKFLFEEAGNVIKDSLKDEIQRVKDVFTTPAQGKGQKTGQVIKAGSGLVNLALSPISALFIAPKNIPVLNTVASLASLPFALTGDIGKNTFDSALQALPIDQKIKDNISEGVGEIGALTGQLLLGGKLFKDTQTLLKEKSIELKKKFGEDGAKTIIEKAKEAAEIVKKNDTIKYEVKENLGVDTKGNKILSQTKIDPVTKNATITIDKSIKNPNKVADIISHENVKINEFRKNVEPTKTVLQTKIDSFVESTGKPLEVVSKNIQRDIKALGGYSKAIETIKNDVRKAEKLGPTLTKLMTEKSEPKVIRTTTHESLIREGAEDLIKTQRIEKILKQPVEKPSKIAEVAKESKTEKKVKELYPEKTTENVRKYILNPETKITKESVRDLRKSKIGLEELKFDRNKKITLWREGSVTIGKPNSFSLIKKGDQKPYTIRKDEILINTTSKKLQEIFNKTYKTELERKTYKEALKKWNKLEAEIIAEPRKIRTIKEAKSTKVSKIAESIKTKALEEKINAEFGDLAEFTPTTIKEQSKLITDIMNRDINEAKAIIKGEVPLPQGLNPIYAIKAMEDYAIKTKDGKLIADLTNSPLVSESSVAAQTMRMAAERNPDSAVFKLRELKAIREKVAAKKLSGKKEVQVKSEIKNKVKNEIKKSAPKVKDWSSFIESIKCPV